MSTCLPPSEHQYPCLPACALAPTLFLALGPDARTCAWSGMISTSRIRSSPERRAPKARSCRLARLPGGPLTDPHKTRGGRSVRHRRRRRARPISRSLRASHSASCPTMAIASPLALAIVRTRLRNRVQQRGDTPPARPLRPCVCVCVCVWCGAPRAFARAMVARGLPSLGGSPSLICACCVSRDCRDCRACRARHGSRWADCRRR